VVLRSARAEAGGARDHDGDLRCRRRHRVRHGRKHLRSGVRRGRPRGVRLGYVPAWRAPGHRDEVCRLPGDGDARARGGDLRAVRGGAPRALPRGASG
jgi:hypothetical protein